MVSVAMEPLSWAVVPEMMMPWPSVPSLPPLRTCQATLLAVGRVKLRETFSTLSSPVKSIGALATLAAELAAMVLSEG